MTSAALDACLCLLLISAAAITVSSVSEPTSDRVDDRADAVADTLAVETVQVAYTLRPIDGKRSEASPEYDRTAHGTLASLLARAAVSTVRVDGQPLTRTNDGFVKAVRERVRERLPVRTQLVVEFRPYPGSHVGRELTVGPTPPSNADVHAAAVHASSGVPALENSNDLAAAKGFAGLGDAVASELVRGLFPPKKGRLALAGDPPVDGLVAHRYAQTSDHYGVRTEEAIERGDTRAANRQLAASMGERVSEELRDLFASPEAAADELRLGDVKIAVRTWSP